MSRIRGYLRAVLRPLSWLALVLLVLFAGFLCCNLRWPVCVAWGEVTGSEQGRSEHGTLVWAVGGGLCVYDHTIVKGDALLQRERNEGTLTDADLRPGERRSQWHAGLWAPGTLEVTGRGDSSVWAAGGVPWLWEWSTRDHEVIDRQTGELWSRTHRIQTWVRLWWLLLPLGLAASPAGRRCVAYGWRGLAWVQQWMGQREGYCRVCGYDLQATPERCPECGAAAGHGTARAG